VDLEFDHPQLTVAVLHDLEVADLGSWRGREPSADEWALRAHCGCPACREHGTRGLRASKLDGV